jgi:hypothetical protein
MAHAMTANHYSMLLEQIKARRIGRPEQGLKCQLMHRIFSLDVPDIRSEASIVTGNEPSSKADKMNVNAKNTVAGH